MDVLRLVTPTHPAAAPLLAGLRDEYMQAYGPEAASDLDAYSTFEFLPPSGAFLVLEVAGVTVAGGALRRLERGVAEIKRMWTAPEHRGRGYSRRVLAALEAAATRRGYHTVRLIPAMCCTPRSGSTSPPATSGSTATASGAPTRARCRSRSG